MQPHQNPIERAFQLSESGKFSSVPQILKALRAEGFSTNQIEGPLLRKQLRERMAAAQAKEGSPLQTMAKASRI
jgi:hypothetical protein